MDQNAKRPAIFNVIHNTEFRERQRIILWMKYATDGRTDGRADRQDLILM